MDRATKIDLIRKWHYDLVHQFEGVTKEKEEAEGKALNFIYEVLADGTLDQYLAEFAQVEANKRKAEIATKVREAEDVPVQVAIIQTEVDELEAVSVELKKPKGEEVIVKK
jgi:hypothetical protein